MGTVQNNLKTPSDQETVFIFTLAIHVSCQCDFQKQHLLQRKKEAQVKLREKMEVCGGAAVKRSIM